MYIYAMLITNFKKCQLLYVQIFNLLEASLFFNFWSSNSHKILIFWKGTILQGRRKKIQNLKIKNILIHIQKGQLYIFRKHFFSVRISYIFQICKLIQWDLVRENETLDENCRLMWKIKYQWHSHTTNQYQSMNTCIVIFIKFPDGTSMYGITA